MALDFPANPTEGTKHIQNGAVFVYTGNRWMHVARADDLMRDLFVARTGDVMQGPLTLAGDPDDPLGAATRQYAEKAVRTHAPSDRNLLINGAFDIWQRGTSFTSGLYTADRWILNKTPGVTVTLDRTNWVSGDARAEGGAHFARVNVTAGGPDDGMNLTQRIEGWAFANQTVTVSFRARAPVGETRRIGVRLRLPHSTGAENVVLGPITIDNSFARYSLTGRWAPSTGLSPVGATPYLECTIDFLSSGFDGSLTGQHGICEISGIQVEPGDVASPFYRRPLSEEVMLCQRYYNKMRTYLFGCTYATNQARSSVSYPVQMRAGPTVTFSSTSDPAPYQIDAYTDGASFRWQTDFAWVYIPTFDAEL